MDVWDLDYKSTSDEEDNDSDDENEEKGEKKSRLYSESGSNQNE